MLDQLKPTYLIVLTTSFPLSSIIYYPIQLNVSKKDKKPSSSKFHLMELKFFLLCALNKKYSRYNYVMTVTYGNSFVIDLTIGLMTLN